MRTPVALLLVLAPATAAATPQSPPVVDPAPYVVLHGATAQNRRLSVRCTSAAQCRVVFDCDVSASSDTELLAQRPPSDRLTIDGRSVDRFALAAGRTVHVHIEATRSVLPQDQDDNLFFFMDDALYARHLVFAPRSRSLTSAHTDSSGLYWNPLAEGELSGPLSVSVELSDDVTLKIDDATVAASTTIDAGRDIRLFADPVAPPPQWVRPGGPLLGLGGYGNGTGFQFVMRLQYDFGITDWMIVSGVIESDFQTKANLALLLGGATPLILIFLLPVASVSTDIGALLEITSQGARGAVRGNFSFHYGPVGVQISLDYFPVGDETIFTIMGCASI